MTTIKSRLDPADTVASQYANSPAIRQLIENFRQNVDPSPDFTNFYNLVWNIDTAAGFGLDILGRVLGVSRQLDVPAIYPVMVAPGLRNLTDDQYRRLLYAKALANISATSSPAINKVLRMLFPGRGNAFVADQGDMHMRYKFLFGLDGYEFAIMLAGTAVPKPAAVKATISTAQPYFGFGEADSWSTFGENQFASY
jgi:hypothetical protein